MIPRVLGTLDAIERELVIDGLVHRFDPTATLGGEQLPMDQFEGAFLPATFWYAHALARCRSQRTSGKNPASLRGDRLDPAFSRKQPMAEQKGSWATRRCSSRRSNTGARCWPCTSKVPSALPAGDMKKTSKPRIIVITGASAGVGRATVRAFAKEGAHIGLIARGQDGLAARNAMWSNWEARHSCCQPMWRMQTRWKRPRSEWRRSSGRSMYG